MTENPVKMAKVIASAMSFRTVSGVGQRNSYVSVAEI